jgi:hypothetical protein
MGIAAASLALASFQMPLLFDLVIAVLSGANRLSGSWLGGSVNSDGSANLPHY